jgi:hypothetical protein
VLDFVVHAQEDEGVGIGPREGVDGPQAELVFLRSDEPRNGRLPLHIDVNATDRDQDAELERLLAAGAERVDIGQTGQEPWHVLADPEGNEFCLLRPRVDPV